MNIEKITETVDTDSNDDSEVNEKQDQRSEFINNNQIEWIEESSESEPELECDIWDEDCVTIHNQRRKNAIDGYHLMPTCSRKDEVPPFKKQKIIESPSLNINLLEKDFMQLFKNKWEANGEIKTKTVDLSVNPFKFCIVDDFVADITVLNKIREEFNELQWNKRNMDLYEFFQSDDLKNIKLKYISYIHEFLKTDIKNWLQQLTGFDLYKMSATGSCYTDTDYLLTHDDLEDDRLIAFILYITDLAIESDKDSWTKEMGGILELFNKDEEGNPLITVKQIIPKNNRFVFFEVTNDSFHQVSEVLNMDHSRLSINGWFHSPETKRYKLPKMETQQTGLYSSERLPPLQVDFPLQDWINPQYLQLDVKKQIQHHVENESEISLIDFFIKDKFHELCEILKNDDIIWKNIGPPSTRKYEVISTNVAPSIVTEVLSLFQSKSMFSLLQEYTDLDFNTDIKNNITPTVRFELQRWTPGNYSLFSEYHWENENELDLILYLGHSEKLKIVGGQTMYLSVGEKVEDALVTLHPKINSLNMVFRDTARIVKYVSKRSFNDYFYMIVCSYKE